MKLWIVNQYARVPSVSGITRHYDITSRLNQYNVSTTIINGNYDHTGEVLPNALYNKIEKSKKPYSYNYNGVNFLTFPIKKYTGNASVGRVLSMMFFYHDVFKYLSRSIDKPDIIWGSTAHPFGTLAAYRLSKKFQIPFIYEIRDLWPLSIIEFGKVSRHHPFILYLDYLDKLFAFKSNLIITTAPLMKKYYIDRWGLPESKFLWVTNGTNIDINSTNDSGETILPENKKEARPPFRIVYTGALGQANGLDEILRVIQANKEKLKNFEFHFWGNGSLKESLSSYIEQNSLPCFIHNPVPKAQIWSVLNQADALLFNLVSSSVTLFQYGISPNKLADYHAAGKPIISIGQYAQNPVIESGAGFAVSSARELPVALLKFQELSPEKKIDMGEKGLKYAEEHYNWGKLAKKLAIELKKLV